MRITVGCVLITLLTGCQTLSDKENLAFIGNVLTLGAASYAAGYNSVPAYQPNADYDWAWDLQRGSNNSPVWICRGKQSGQYSDHSKCAYKYQADNTWPGY